MPDRSAHIKTFLAQTDWETAARRTIAGDASNRRYERLKLPGGATAILMDAPPDRGEDTRTFAKITDFLRHIGLSAPEIFAADHARGFLLLEDLGDDLFARLLESDPERERSLYSAATDVLLHLHGFDPPDLIRCDAERLVDMIAPAFTWYRRGVLGDADEPTLRHLQSTFLRLLEPLNATSNVMIQRDYHAENLLWLPDRSGVARVGLLDYQDALIGHRAYDLVSILQDARRDVSQDVTTEMIAYYAETAQIPLADFEAAYALLGVQRNLRILGVFSRLCLAGGKPHYVEYIPRVWGHVQTNLQHPALQSVAPLITASLPQPTASTLQELKDKCASFPKA